MSKIIIKRNEQKQEIFFRKANFNYFLSENMSAIRESVTIKKTSLRRLFPSHKIEKYRLIFILLLNTIVIDK